MDRNSIRYNVLRIDAVKMYKQGVSIGEIAERLDISKMIVMAMIERGARNE